MSNVILFFVFVSKSVPRRRMWQMDRKIYQQNEKKFPNKSRKWNKFYLFVCFMKLKQIDKQTKTNESE